MRRHVRRNEDRQGLRTRGFGIDGHALGVVRSEGTLVVQVNAHPGLCDAEYKGNSELWVPRWRDNGLPCSPLF